MSHHVYDALKELQELDARIREVRDRLATVDERMAEAEEPALVLEAELKAVQERVERMKAEERKLERAADEKRERLVKLEERLRQVRNVREEAAVAVERDLLKRGADADEQEALSLLDGIRRAESHGDELAAKAAQAREEVEPKRRELQAERDEAERVLRESTGIRDESFTELDDRERRVYESFQAGGRSVVVASLTEDGACGNCFGMVPLQQQAEVRSGQSMVRCEACGVILTPPIEASSNGDGPTAQDEDE